VRAHGGGAAEKRGAIRSEGESSEWWKIRASLLEEDEGEKRRFSEVSSRCWPLEAAGRRKRTQIDSELADFPPTSSSSSPSPSPSRLPSPPLPPSSLPTEETLLQRRVILGISSALIEEEVVAVARNELSSFSSSSSSSFELASLRLSDSLDPFDTPVRPIPSKIYIGADPSSRFRFRPSVSSSSPTSHDPTSTSTGPPRPVVTCVLVVFLLPTTDGSVGLVLGHARGWRSNHQEDSLRAHRWREPPSEREDVDGEARSGKHSCNNRLESRRRRSSREQRESRRRWGE